MGRAPAGRDAALRLGWSGPRAVPQAAGDLLGGVGHGFAQGLQHRLVPGARRAALAGAGLVAAADLLLAQAGHAARPTDLSWRLALAGLGMGLFSGPNQTIIMNAAPRHALATAGAATALTRSLGFALGPALSTLIWASGGYPATGLKTALLLPSAAAALAGPALGATSLLSRTRGRNRNASHDHRPALIAQPLSAGDARAAVRCGWTPRGGW